MSNTFMIIFGTIGIGCIVVAVIIYLINYAIKKNTEAKYKYHAHKRAEESIDNIAEEIKNHREQD